mgnify:FL=1
MSQTEDISGYSRIRCHREDVAEVAVEAATAAPAVQITEIIMPITAIQIMETPTTETPTTETLTMEIPTTVIPATTIQTMATIPTMEITSQTRIKQFL